MGLVVGVDSNKLPQLCRCRQARDSDVERKNIYYPLVQGQIDIRQDGAREGNKFNYGW
jgi:ferredoxin-thioredoxin reductase catalytic subunit